jgi:hypothetical protein
MKYKVINRYGIGGESNLRMADAACKAAIKRGYGWIAVDEYGNQYALTPNGEAIKL